MLPGSGGQLNHLSVITLDVAGAYSKWALNISEAQYGLGLAIGLELGLDGALSIWTHWAIWYFPFILVDFPKLPLAVSAF